MSHPEQASFIKLIRDLNTALIENARILEIGSYDVYGSTRGLFIESREYIGIDLCAGPSVDLVLNAHDLDKTDLGKFEFVISCETLEHDPDWKTTVKNMVETTSLGGAIVITCATTLRPEHGTTRTSVHESPGTTSVGWDHYENVSVSELEDFIRSLETQTRFRIWENKRIFDLYCLIERPQADAKAVVFPSDEDLRSIIRSTPFLFSALRWPIRIVAKLFGLNLGEKFGLIYWGFFTRNFQKHVRSNQD